MRLSRLKGISEMQLAPLSLKFTGDHAHLEEPFQNYYNKSTLRQARVAGLLSMVFYALFGIMDVYWAPEHKEILWMIRYGCVSPIFVICLAVVYSKKFNPKYLQGLISALIILAGVSIIAMMAVVAPKMFSAGLVVVLFINFTAIGARFTWATFSAFVITVVYNLAAFFILHPPVERIVAINVITASLMGIGFFACYSLEYKERASFFLSYLLKEEQRKVLSINAGLEKRIEERTAELEKSNLNLTLEMEEHRLSEKKRARLELELRHAQYMKAIGTLAGGVAHDFNNLLMGIQSRASLILITSDPGHKHYEHARGIEKLVKSASDLTRQLLNLARGGKRQAQPSNLNQLILKTAHMFGRTKKEVSIHTNLLDNLWVVDVNRTQFEQVLLNLLLNAWQAMPQGGNIFIQTENRSLIAPESTPGNLPPGDYVTVSVADTGIGMDQETLKRIFDPFFTTKEMGRGSGLGLASAYGIVDNHGGAIQATSQKGKGSRFEIFLPRSGNEIPQEEEQEPAIVNGSGLILIIDDEYPALHACRELLESLGYTVIGSQNPLKGIRIYQEKQDEIQMVVLDIIMPEMSGVEVFGKLREINPQVKILISSGYSMDGSVAELMERGCNGFVQKPYNIQIISQKIHDILE
ncbi:Response regulator receiver domain-containing protein [Desulfatibacillum alkenivorans DSM 16219]|jgi:signal transduction histidine kinase|uniref:histidine kinase n=1 Tax=Desulfatibacillum alkenivorans DSM 16219 TaxID=1121393 RepID=A0A1M6IA17_9BACT|nr:ATP-binding protein [Desulfatibacillum alkenivorans]SHJ31291.1 Response regulator receiver domain-containing protein [Desulfatibacillum alkenivorans DSM 16219]